MDVRAEAWTYPTAEFSRRHLGDQIVPVTLVQTGTDVRCPIFLVQGKTLAQINPAYFRIFAQLFRGSGAEDAPFIDDVSTIGNGERFADIVVSNQHPDSARFQIEDDLL